MRPNVASYRTIESDFSRKQTHSRSLGFAQQQPQYQQQQSVAHLWNNPGCFQSNSSCQLKAPTAPLHNVSQNFIQPLQINHCRNLRGSQLCFTAQRFSAYTDEQSNYGKIGGNALHQQRINDCAGIPLISSASSHLLPSQRQRSQQKTLNSTPHTQNPSPHTLNWNLPLYGQGSGKCMSQLAAHAHGVPLLLNKNQNVSAHWSPVPPTGGCKGISSMSSGTLRSNFNNDYQTEDEFSMPSVYPKEDKPKTPLPIAYSCTKENIEQQLQASSTTNLQFANTRGLAETCLPRIIKPRKRRKKDRKPANGVFLKVNDETNVLNNSLVEYKNPKSSIQSAEVLKTFDSNDFGTSSGVNQVLENHFQTKMNKASLLCVESISTPHNPHGVCFCRQCDPLRRIWDFPLRRSYSDSSAASVSDESFSSSSSTTLYSSQSSARRAEIVGVIGSGSNRFNGITTGAAALLLNNGHNNSFTKSTNGSQSDSNDSGFGEILSGINIVDDLFSATSTGKPISSRSSLDCKHVTKAPTKALLLHPNTAESLLNESINEISRKLIETCSSTSCSKEFSDGLSSFSNDSKFSNESGIDSLNSNENELVFSFDQLTIANSTIALSKMDPTPTTQSNNNNNQTCKSFPPEFSANQTNFLFPPTTELLLDINNNGLSEKCESIPQLNQPFFSNCFDLVWHNSNSSTPKRQDSITILPPTLGPTSKTISQ